MANKMKNKASAGPEVADCRTEIGKSRTGVGKSQIGAGSAMLRLLVRRQHYLVPMCEENRMSG